MKEVVKCFVITCLLIGLASVSAFAAIAEYNEGEVLVVMKAPKGTFSTMSASSYSAAMKTQAVTFAQKASLSTVCTYDELSQSSGSNIALFKSEGKTTKQLIEELKDDPEVLSVSANYKRTLSDVPKEGYSLTADPMLFKQWGLNRINTFEVWDNYNVKPGVTVYVAVLDMGVDYNHEDLKDNIAKDGSGKVIGKSFYGNGKHTDDDPIDRNKNGGHGTHVAGIIGAVGNNNNGIVGVHHKNIKIIPVNVFSGDGPRDGCWDADIIKGLEYVLALKKGGLNVRVVNMSLGGWSTPPIKSEPRGAWEFAMQELSDAEVLLVVAAGNDDSDIPALDDNASADVYIYPFPASFWKVQNRITVGSVSPVTNKRSYFSNYDTGGVDSGDYRPANVRFVDMTAPGEYILSTIPGNRYDYKNGTSMATPFVSGAAALLCSFFPDKSATEIKNAILNNTFTGRGEGYYWTHGSLNVGKAYLQFDKNPVTAIKPDPRIEEQHPVVLEITGGDSVNMVQKTLLLSVYPDPEGVWTSRNNTVATITQTGLLTAQQPGTAEIVYTSKYNEGVIAASKIIEILDIYDEGSLGCSAGAATMLAVPFVFFLWRKRK